MEGGERWGGERWGGERWGGENGSTNFLKSQFSEAHGQN